MDRPAWERVVLCLLLCAVLVGASAESSKRNDRTDVSGSGSLEGSDASADPKRADVVPSEEYAARDGEDLGRGEGEKGAEDGEDSSSLEAQLAMMPGAQNPARFFEVCHLLVPRARRTMLDRLPPQIPSYVYDTLDAANTATIKQLGREVRNVSGSYAGTLSSEFGHPP